MGFSFSKLIVKLKNKFKLSDNYQAKINGSKKLKPNFIRNLIVKNIQALKKNVRPFIKGVSISLIVGTIVILVRYLGLLQFLEYDLFDWYYNWRTLETIDERIVLVEIKEEDLSRLNQYPMSDYELYEILSKIQEQEPRVIGLDIYRDLPVNPDFKNGANTLIQFLDKESSSNIIGIEKSIAGQNSPAIKPNEILSAYGQVGANDIFLDPDGIVRRIPLSIAVQQEQEAIGAAFSNKKVNKPSFHYLLAYLYLEQEETQIILKTSGEYKLGDRTVPLIYPNSGGYINTYSGGYQSFLNYRTSPKFKSVTLSDLKDSKISADFFKDKVVILCSNTPSFPDYFNTPKGQRTGGELQAYATSQLISAALDDRPFIKTWPEWNEIIWIILWCFLAANTIIQIGKVQVWKWDVGQKTKAKNLKRFFTIKVISITIFLSFAVWLITLIAFLTESWWLPIVPVILGIVLSSISSAFWIYIEKLRQAHDTKDSIIFEQTQQLRQQNLILIATNKELELRKEQLIAQEKLANLGEISSGLAHNIGNCTNSLNSFVPSFSRLVRLIQDEINQEQAIDKNLINQYSLKILEINSQLNANVIAANKMMRQVKFYGSNRVRFQTNLVKSNINKLIESIVEQIRYSLSNRGNEHNSSYIYQNLSQTFLLSLDSSIQDFYFDESDLYQVIQNLLINAFDSVESRAYSQTQEEYQPKIEVSTYNEGTSIKISIQDNGEGISPDFLKVMFKPFMSTKEGEKGIGLGLTTVKNCLKKSGATYEVESNSEPGSDRGTRFIIFWPKITESVGD